MNKQQRREEAFRLFSLPIFPSGDQTPLVECYDTGDNYVFWCFFCEKMHEHGRQEGHRVAHCAERSITHRNEWVDSPFKDTGYILCCIGSLTSEQEKFRNLNFHYQPVPHDWPRLCFLSSQKKDISGTMQDRVEIFRYLERLLHDATIWRHQRDEEDRLNQRRKKTDWTKSDVFQAKMQEIQEYLNPGRQPTGLHAKYCYDDSFECIVIISD